MCNGTFFIAKLSSIKVRTTHRMNATTFSNLVKMGGGMKKKGKKKKKGKPGKVNKMFSFEQYINMET